MILYSFRRCPYAMRARMALRYAGCPVQICEVSLKAKPADMLALSPKGTVPVLSVDGEVLEESLQIMHWALARHDPQNW
ncbi:MAG: glutathione S-transferase N-terminal domain-containing protein, partial [Pseudomonas qingdaonensis]